jgi:hypothetical protein
VLVVQSSRKSSRFEARLGRIVRAPLFVLTALVSACGGGGGDGGGDPPASVGAEPTTSLAITSFAPSSGGVGSVITVTGSGFTGVQNVRIGSLETAFTVVSDAELAFAVPAGAQSGRIELAAAGRTVLSASDLAVTLVPQLAAVTPTTVLPGARVTLAGVNLDRVTRVRVNATTLPIVSQTSTAIAVDVPVGATSGAITLEDASGSRPQPQQLTIVAPLALTSFSPTSIVTGRTLTINGTALDRATEVVFTGGASAPIATRNGSTRITVTVPDAAATGALRVRGNAADEAVSASPLTVTPAIRVDASAVYRVATAGASVTITGSGLMEVSAVSVQGTTAPIVSRSASQLIFTVPPAVTCGPISLLSSSQPSVAAGSVIVGAGCSVTIGGIEFGQVVGQSTTDVRQRLVPGKETWVRVYLLSTEAGLVSPTVRLTGYRGAAILGTISLTGPATLPQSSGAAVPAAVRYSETQSFNAELPAAWVAAGLSIRVEVDPEQRFGPMTTLDATPNVGSQTRLEVVLVPVVSGGFVPTVPSASAVLNEITRRFPIARDRISVTTRASYTLTSTTNGLDTQSEWSSALSELRQLRDAENPGNTYRYYFGFVRRAGGGIAGIGYLPGRAALGWDSSTGWSRTLSHELGHNFGRPHAPCGGVTNPDPSYPPEYANGILGPQPLIDSVPPALDVLSPVNQTDIMGYCNGVWFSDYNYRLLQTHLEAQPQAMLAQAQFADAPADLLLISGRLGVEGVTLNPLQALRGTPSSQAGGYTLRLTTRDGRTIDHPFDAQEVDHGEPLERHFSVSVLNPGPLERAEVRQDGVMLPLATGLARAQTARTAVAEPLALDWSERAGRLDLQWNGGAASYVSVTHVLNGTRTVLALNRQGGSLSVDTSGLPPGGTFEVSATNRFSAHAVTLQR